MESLEDKFFLESLKRELETADQEKIKEICLTMFESLCFYKSFLKRELDLRPDDFKPGALDRFLKQEFSPKDDQIH